MIDLAFRLRVPNRDRVTLAEASSTTFRFEGRTRPTSEGLQLEWRGVAQVQAFGLRGVRDEHLSLPHEGVLIPYTGLAGLSLRGRWWWPYVDVVSADLEALRVIPSEEMGRVRLWISRLHQREAMALIAAVNGARQSPEAAAEFATPSLPPQTTPPGGVE
jgi:hypothetical protein